MSVFGILLWMLMLLFFFLIFVILIQPLIYWKIKGVKTSRIVPLIGDEVFRKYFGKDPYAKVVQTIYNEAKNARYIAFCQFRQPLLMINCPELIKQLFVRDADHFSDHRYGFPENTDKIMPNTMVYLKGQEWKNVRSVWNSFLNSNKIGKMYPILSETIQVFLQQFVEQEQEIIEFEIRDTFRKCTCYLSASTYFGISPHSSGNEIRNFFLNVIRTFPHLEDNFLMNIKFCLTALFPTMSWFTGYRSIIDKDAETYFFDTVETVCSREKYEHRNDMIGTWLEMEKEENDTFSDDMKKKRIKLSEKQVTCQLCMFLFSSIDGLATTMKFISYELATNQNVQKKLLEEIDEVIKTEGVEPSYNTIMSLTYMDMVINETMRKWPAVINLERVCTKSYKIEPELPGEIPVQIDVGDVLMAPLYALHHDSIYFPDPEKFDPERFSLENKHKIKPYTYMPWGIGPRNCNGIKLSTLMMKTLFFQLLTNFQLVCTGKTKIPIELQGARVSTEDDVFLGLKRRKSREI